MDLDRLTAFANAPERTRAELDQMKTNALARGNVEFAKMINESLLRRFPYQAKSGSGQTPQRYRSKVEPKRLTAAKRATCGWSSSFERIGRACLTTI